MDIRGLGYVGVRAKSLEDWESFGTRFLGMQLGTVQVTVPQPTICADYLACLEAISVGAGRSIEASYGPSGTCWTTGSATAIACTNACQDGLRAQRASSNAPLACFQ